MSEKEEAVKLANQLLDEPNVDPDDNLRVLSRQLLRARETVERQERALQAVDWNASNERDLIESNRDQILEVHREAVQRVARLLEQSTKSVSWNETTRLICVALLVLDRLNQFHPMHCESWAGWPEGSEP